ncbi:hypothetical protein O4H25_15160, partial [Staphylococcus equorum]|uniref:hypothetical protein n=1 Tax=Staphylococcus equorum TaxID=246432 RepID=UPI0022AEC1DF
RQHDVLDDVGKAAGMEGVTVVHARGLRHRTMKVTVIPLAPSADPENQRLRARGFASPGMTPVRFQPPLTGGMVTWSSGQA